jgi:hypothetical protein
MSRRGNDGPILTDLLWMLGVVVIVCGIGFLQGASFGAEKACKSIGTEWHGYKCVTVTRKAVKP